VELVDPVVHDIDNRQRAPPSFIAARVGVEGSLFAVGLDRVEIGEELERDSCAAIFGEQGSVELLERVRISV
jgi:hypothetical protein